MYGSAAMAAAAALLREMPRLPLRSAARPVAPDGGSAYSMAMHIHSSFSEQSGSMDCQLYQAATNAVDVLWWTDHDARMDGIDYRDTVHFTSLTSEKGGPGQGGAWIWKRVESGPLAAGSGGGIVTQPYSPNDPVPGGSMHLAAASNSSQPATYGYYADCHPAGWNYRDNLTGQSLSIDVLLTPGWHDGYLELRIVTSYHQASGGRPAGDYVLSYRFVPAGTPGGRTAQGLEGVITIPVAPSGSNPWYTASISPSDDIAALWPDLDYRDFALYELTLSAVAAGGALVDGYFDYLRFDRSVSGEAFLQQQAEMSAALASTYPTVVQQQGLEVSWRLPHLNWFGGQVTMPDYGNTLPKDYTQYLANTAVPQIHSAGGLVSYNHPFGYSQVPVLPPAQQDALLQQVAKQLLPGSMPAALGCDLLEVGYNSRAGIDLAHHVALWDVMSRNAIFLTGNGVSDDHFGLQWDGLVNNWVTSAWAASTAQADLLAAMAAGRAWCGSLSDYRGSLDLLADGSCPMGSASVSKQSSRQLTVSASQIPAAGSLQLLQGTVDYAGTYGLSSNAGVIARYPAAQLFRGSVTLPVDTTKDSFVRSEVLDSSGRVVAVSNPVWLLRKQPPGGIPGPRRA